MKRNLLIALGLLVSTVNITLAGNSPSDHPQNRNGFHFQKGITDNDYVQKTIIVKIKPEYRTLCAADKISDISLQKVFDDIRLNKIEKVFPTHQPPASERNAYGQKLVDLSMIYKINYSSDIRIEKVINMLMGTGRLEYAEPSYLYKPLYMPNDTAAPHQYHLAKIKAFQAWDITKGDSDNFWIGITDTGFDTTHPELSQRAKHNGWNVAYNNNNVYGPVALHGTFVAGIGCAQADNIIDGAGVGFNTKFLPVACGIPGNYIVNGEQGIVYAADNNCVAVNCSWGNVGARSQYSQDIVDYATFNQNCLVVAAAGNNNNDELFYPASYQHVISVAGTDTIDHKWTGSSYGCGVDISTPGYYLYSIDDGNTNMIHSGGTSEAAPQVTAGAALVKTQFPSLNALQIGERLRVTSDDIDTVTGNAPYYHQLGGGRLNLFNAVSVLNVKSVRAYDFNIGDNNDNVFVGGDTLSISAIFTNYLDPLSNLNITLTTNSPDINILNGAYNPGAMTSMQADSNRTNPFRIKILPSASMNERITFTLNYSDGSYTDWQCFNVYVNVDYINIDINEVATTITSTGRMAFNDVYQEQGIGFTYHHGVNLMFSGSLVIGANPNQVVDMTEGYPQNTMDTDFVHDIYVHHVIPSVVSDFDAATIFNDDSIANNIGVQVNHRAYAWINPPDSKFIIYDFTIKNKSSILYDSLYAGIFADWDMTTGDPNNVVTNIANYDSLTHTGWQHDIQSGGLYAGIKLLTSDPIHYYAFNNDGSGGSINVYTNFSKAIKYQVMSSLSRLATSAPTDASMLLSTGPFSVPAGDSIHVAFALLAADSLAGLLAAATEAQIKYNNIGVGIANLQSSAFGLTSFPNPSGGISTIQFTLPERTFAELSIYNVLGQKISTLCNSYQSKGIHQYHINAAQLDKGMYFYELKTSDASIVKKMVIE